jgi:hypothetical protein
MDFLALRGRIRTMTVHMTVITDHLGEPLPSAWLKLDRNASIPPGPALLTGWVEAIPNLL